jgi:predicted transcriptional regulator
MSVRKTIAGDVERNLAIIEGIKKGLNDMRAGRVVPHNKVMRQLRATITRVEKDKKAKRGRQSY